jgi:hypothetical protein
MAVRTGHRYSQRAPANGSFGGGLLEAKKLLDTVWKWAYQIMNWKIWASKCHVDWAVF